MKFIKATAMPWPSSVGRCPEETDVHALQKTGQTEVVEDAYNLLCWWLQELTASPNFPLALFQAYLSSHLPLFFLVYSKL